MRIARGIFLALLIGTFPFAESGAQGLTGRIGIAPIIGGGLPIQYLQSTEGGGRATFGFAGGASGEYFITDEISVGGRFMFDRFGMDLENSDLSGNWTMIEFGAFARCRFMPGKPTRPFARAGLLMGKPKAKVSNGSETETDIGLAPGAELAGGVIHELKENLLLFGELNWTGLATDGKDADEVVDGETVRTDEFPKHLQWVGLKVGVIFLLGGASQ